MAGHCFVLETASQPLSVCLSVFGTKENGHTEPTGTSCPSILGVLTWCLQPIARQEFSPKAESLGK